MLMSENLSTHVLVVDDDAMILSTILEFLKRYGYSYEKATSGPQALDVLHKHDFDLVISDISMPEMSGIELMQSAKNSFPDLNFIIMTGYSSEYAYEDIINAGAADFLTKPFSMGELKATICRIEREGMITKDLQASNTQLETAIAQSNRMTFEAETVRMELDHIFNTSSNGMCLIDADFKVMRINKTLLNLLGLKESNVINKKCHKVLDIDLCNTPVCPLNQILKGKKEIEYDLEKELADGKKIHLNITATPFRGLDGGLVGVLYDLKDITERKRFEEQLLLFAGVFENTLEGICITNPQGIIEKANSSFTVITGYRTDEAIGQTHRFFKPNRQEPASCRMLEDSLVNNGLWKGEIENFRKNGEAYIEGLSMTAIKNSRGKVTHYVIVFRDITASKQSEEQIKYQATHDALTGLPNRQLFNDRLKKSLAHARRYQQKLAVMFLDLDDFKNINDSLGHQVGDLFLKEIARRLKVSCRDSDTVARLGGDEFTLILPDIKQGDHNAIKMAHRIFEAFAEPVVLGDHELHASASIGITLYPNDGNDCATLLKNADMAMYRAKEKGKNTCTLFEKKINDAVLRRIDLESGLRKALEGGEFRIHYQPKVEIRTGSVSGAEALVRWQRADGELVSPYEFISLAEDIGVIYPLGEWVLRSACRQMKVWHDAGYNHLTIAVNLSAKQFQDKNLLRLVQEILLETDLAPKFLNLEVTENIVMCDVEIAISIMQQLSKMGVRISIDDFGTGYSSLSYLKKFPLDVLKIDRSFVQDIPDDSDDVAIAEAILSLGQSLKLKVVAEGVETNEQLKFMQTHGCDEIQGYLFSKPLPTRKFTSLLKQGRKLQTENSGPSKIPLSGVGPGTVSFSTIARNNNAA